MYLKNTIVERPKDTKLCPSGRAIYDLPAKTDSKKFRPMIQNARSIYFRISYG